MAEYILSAQERTVVGKKVRQLRTQELVPVVVYGAEIESKALQIPYRELERTLMSAGGTNLIDLQVANKDESFKVLAYQVQRDPIRGEIKHVDFFAVNDESRVVIDVPIVLIGESAAVTSRRGIMLTGPNSLRVEMRAVDMLDEIRIDLANHAEVGSSLYVRDLQLGGGARVLNNPDEMILRIAQSSAARREEALSKAATTSAPAKKK